MSVRAIRRGQKGDDMNKFKLGDLIELTDKGSVAADKGATAIVTGYDNDNKYVQVKWIRDKLAKTQSDGGYYEKSFTLIEHGQLPLSSVIAGEIYILKGGN